MARGRVALDALQPGTSIVVNTRNSCYRFVVLHDPANRVRGVVTEPEPGRVLVETYLESGVVTTFRVEPAGAGESVVTISSLIPARHALTRPLERWIVIRALTPVFEEEHLRIEAYVSSSNT